MDNYDKLLGEGWIPANDYFAEEGFIILEKDDMCILFNRILDKAGEPHQAMPKVKIL